MNYFGYYPYPVITKPFYPSFSNYSSLKPKVQPLFQTSFEKLKQDKISNIQDQFMKWYYEEQIKHHQEFIRQEQEEENKNQIYKNNQKPKSKQRRLAHQIERQYVCPITTCKKAYGSEGSLGQHLKIKHQSYYKSFSFPGKISQEKNQQNIAALQDGKQTEESTPKLNLQKSAEKAENERDQSLN